MPNKRAFTDLERSIDRLEKELIEAKHEQEILRRREEKFGVIADSTPMAMMLYQDDRWLYINRAAETISGYSVRELLDMHFLELIHPDYRSAMDDIPPGEEHIAEFKIRTKNGADKWVSGAKTFAMIEERPASVISMIDVSDLKRAEEALRTSEEKYRLLVETVADVIFTMDDKLRLTYISPTITNLRGFTVEEAMAQDVTEILTPASLNVALKVFSEEMAIEMQEIKDRSRTRVLELEEYCKDGSTIWTESIFHGMRDEEGKFVGLLGITRDISDRVQAQKEREKLMLEKQRALSEIKILSGMLPICSSCKKIRDDQGYWNQIETYIGSHSEANFSHGICPDCAKRLYPAQREQNT